MVAVANGQKVLQNTLKILWNKKIKEGQNRDVSEKTGVVTGTHFIF